VEITCTDGAYGLRHYRAAAEAHLSWPQELITRRVPVSRFAEAFTPDSDDIKVVLALTEGFVASAFTVSTGGVPR
jgi:hypothetical protein